MTGTAVVLGGWMPRSPYKGRPQATDEAGRIVGDPYSGDITVDLRAWGAGDQAAFERLLTSVYPELKRLARRQRRLRRPRPTVSPQWTCWAQPLRR